MREDRANPEEIEVEPRRETTPWRSLGERSGSPDFAEILSHEFPQQQPLPADGVDRRRFLQLMGASLAFAGATACTRQPYEKIVPYVEQPEILVPGRPLFYATAATLGGYATGILAESHEGRPTKVEGNPDHPASLGSTDAITQARILELYDPDRSQAITHLGRIRTWAAFLSAVATVMAGQEGKAGRGMRFLTGTVTSPTLAGQLEKLLQRFPEARWYQYEAAGRHAAHLGTRAAFGEWAETRYDVAAAEVILALDADFLSAGPGSVRYTRDFAAGRRPAERMKRLYSVESTPTGTGVVADHRLALRPSEVGAFAVALAAELGVPGAQRPDGFSGGERGRWVSAVAADLRSRRGKGLVVAGEHTSAELHTLAHGINAALGNLGSTVLVSDPVEARPTDQLADIRQLAEELAADQVDVLFLLGTNPVYDAPADLDFVSRLNASKALRIHYGLYDDETAPYCQWHLPATHFLETWGDARAYDGTTTIQQPLILPLYDGKSVHELLAALEGQIDTSDHDLVKQAWQGRLPGEDFDAAWHRAIHDGVVPDTALPHRERALDRRAVERAAATLAADGEAGLELSFRPDAHLWDGRFANNGWLMECPRPLTKLTWDNALLLSPATARELGVENEEVVQVMAADRTVEVPVWVLPGQADGSATLHLGYGHREGGGVAEGAGFDVGPLRTVGAFWQQRGVRVTRTGRRYTLASTQEHWSMEGRHLVREASREQYREEPDFAREMEEQPAPDESLYPGYSYDRHAWGMSIDLTACLGCNACVVACQSENNIAVVGKEQVLAGREMHWLRIDRYFAGDADAPSEIHHQPVPCMQCENAPCEVVCPVAATVHSAEGLNDMVYNRCIGTRYCSNNCPYKVRRFNFFLFQDWSSPSLDLMRNPDVTVRSRGVMEKCTYCVQRINEAKIHAKTEDRKVRDGEIRTACQQACPADVIVFGDINDPRARVTRRKAEARNYALLSELNTRPRTTYLARITNPNPELEGS